MKNLLFILVILFFSTIIYSQEYIKGPYIVNTDYVWLDAGTLEIAALKLHKPEFVRLREHSEWLKTILSSSPEVEFILIESFIDDIGQLHYRYQQTFKSHPIEGAQYIINKYKGRIFSINGKYVNLVHINSIKINKNEAYLIASKEIEIGEIGTYSNKPKLVIFNNILCYKFDIYYPEAHLSIYSYINAETGAIVKNIREY